MNKNIQLASIIYEFTLAFCKRYIPSPSQSRLIINTAASAKKELKLSSLSELQDKYQDFLDKNDLDPWPEYSLRLRSVRGIAFRPFCTLLMYKPFLSSPERAANAAICLIKQIKFRLGEEKTKSALDYRGALLLNEI